MLYRYYFFILFFIALASRVSSQTISTIAGGAIGHGGFWGDGGPATDAEFTFGGFTVAPNGDIYIGDVGNHRIRKVDINTGIITTIAGTGVPGYNGEGVPALMAQLNFPGFPKFDLQGNLFFTDQGNNRIRMINNASGLISTFAGNGIWGYSGENVQATASNFDFGPFTFDRNGEMLVQTGHHKVKKILSNGIIITVIGTGIPGNYGNGGLATLANISPIGAQISVDTFDNIYFVDSFHNVRKVAKNTSIISNFAGSSDYIGSPYTGDGLQATNSHISPFSVTNDDTGNLYVVDGVNARIIKVSMNGLVFTIAGNGIQGFSGDNGNATSAEIKTPEYVVLDNCNNIYIGDFGNKRIRKVTFFPDCKLSVPNITGSNNLSIHPNPTKGTLFLEYSKNINSFFITNYLGQTMISQYLNGVEKAEIDVSFLLPGMYFIKVNDEYWEKFIKQ